MVHRATRFIPSREAWGAARRRPSLLGTLPAKAKTRWSSIWTSSRPGWRPRCSTRGGGRNSGSRTGSSRNWLGKATPFCQMWFRPRHGLMTCRATYGWYRPTGAIQASIWASSGGSTWTRWRIRGWLACNGCWPAWRRPWSRTWSYWKAAAASTTSPLRPSPTSVRMSCCSPWTRRAHGPDTASSSTIGVPSGSHPGFATACPSSRR